MEDFRDFLTTADEAENNLKRKVFKHALDGHTLKWGEKLTIVERGREGPPVNCTNEVKDCPKNSTGI